MNTRLMSDKHDLCPQAGRWAHPQPALPAHRPPRPASGLFAGLAFSVAALVANAPAGLVLENGFERGAADWGATGVWKPQPSDAVSFTTSSREGSRSIRFVPHADRRQVRSELVLRAPFNDIALTHGTQTWDGKFNWGTEYWQGFSIRVTKPLNGFGIVFQHHAVPALVNGRVDWDHAAGENSFLLKTRGNNFIIHTATIADNVEGAEIVEPTGLIRRRAQTGAATWGTAATEPIPFEPGRWYDFVLHFRLAPDRTGIMQVWTRDGETAGAPWVSRVDVTAGVTVYKYDSGKPASSGKVPVGGYRDGLPKFPASTQKIGLYYGNNVSGGIGGEVCYDAFRIWAGPGGSIEAVAPPDVAGPPTNPPTGPTVPSASKRIP